MRGIRSTPRFLGVWVLMACCGAAEAADSYGVYTGTARPFKGGAVLYHERHFTLLRDERVVERVVLYTCDDGTPFARKVATYAEPLAPDFDFDDASNGMQQGVRRAGGTRSMYFRGTARGREITAPLPAGNLVIDTGFDGFIQSQWPALMAGQAVPLHFLVPSRQEAMDFEVQRLRSDTVEGKAAEVFRMQLKGLLGRILSGIDVTYSADSHVLMRYQGLADLRDRDGDNFKADIVFPLKERKSGDAEQFAAAHHATLQACR